jgi:hypothetical protein
MIAINWERFDKAPDGTLHPRVSLVEHMHLAPHPQIVEVEAVRAQYEREIEDLLRKEEEEREMQDRQNIAIWDEVRGALIENGEFDVEEIDDEA